jgi:xanthine dehydrogenase YagS FAD-binding subunit
MKAFEWANATSVDDAVKLLKPTDSRADIDEQPLPMGGGQDLLTSMKHYISRPSRVVNLKTIDGIGKIETSPAGLSIGATTTLTQLIEHPEVAKNFPGLTEAALSIATPQIRNLGTVGGNLCQRPRCWYFRMESVKCLKKGGDTCYAVDGENKYHSILGNDGPSVFVHPSDLAPMLMALDATLSVTGPTGKREIPLGKFFTLPDDKTIRRENVLGTGDVITEIHVPAAPLAARSTYLKFKERSSLDFAMSAVAAAVELAGDKTVKQARIVLGGVAPIPWRVQKAEAFLVGKKLDEATVTRAAAIALDGATPLDQNAYKIPLTQTLVRRALTKLNV